MKRDWQAINKGLRAGELVRCATCRGHIGRNYYDRGRPCSACAGVGYVARTKPPANSCSSCGDYAGPGRERCVTCERDTAANMNVPGDNWRGAVRFPRSRYR